jgi:hypothetical protein
MSVETKLNPNSALYWLPAAEEMAKEYPVNVPDTRAVEFDFLDALPMLDGEVPDNFPYGDLDAAACELGWPVFIRSDLSSAKHDGIGAIQADNADAVVDVVEQIIHDAAMKTMRPAAFLVREWIDIDHKFTDFGGLPIGVEFRAFATPDEHICTHYYWPEDAVDDPTQEVADIGDLPTDRELMADTRLPPWLSAVSQGAAFEADFQHGIDDPDRAWSVDFARGEDGEWWLIDMALAEDSWHPECDQSTITAKE